MTKLLDKLRAQGEVIVPRSASGETVGGPGWDASEPDRPAAPEPAADRRVDPNQVVAEVRQSLLDDSSGLLTGNMDMDRLLAAVKNILRRDSLVVEGMTREALATLVVNEIAGYGPLEHLLRDPMVTDVMVNCPDEVYCERGGVLMRSECSFRDETHLRNTVGRILAPLGRRLDNLNPYVDARLPDGSRLNVVIPPLATRGWTVTIRRFRQEPMTIEDLADSGLGSQATAALLRALVEAKLNMLIAGPAGSGKTTLLNALCMCVPQATERIITIEDAHELRIVGTHHVSLEARPPNLEGLGEVTIRQLVRNALRMRPDRLVIGEVRDGAAYDFMQAINTGHNGSMCTVHANSATDALHRMENLALTSGSNLVLQALRQQLASALDLVVHLTRDADGRRLLSEVAVVMGHGEELRAQDILAPSAGQQGLQTLRDRAELRGGSQACLTVGKLLRRVREEVGQGAC